MKVQIEVKDPEMEFINRIGNKKVKEVTFTEFMQFHSIMHKWEVTAALLQIQKIIDKKGNK